MHDEKFFADAIKAVRENKKIGAGSCSTIDECYVDAELRALITETMEGHPFMSIKGVVKRLIAGERVRNDYEADIRSEGAEEHGRYIDCGPQAWDDKGPSPD